MSEYFSSTNRQFGRARCLGLVLRSIREKSPMPDSLCYVRSFEYFRLQSTIEEDQDEKKKKKPVDEPTTNPISIILHDQPEINPAIVFRESFYEPGTLFLCSKRSTANETDLDAFGLENYVWYWLEICGIWEIDSPTATHFEKPLYAPWCDVAECSSPFRNRYLRPITSNVLNRNGRTNGATLVFDRWEDVVELTYGMSMNKKQLLDGMTPPDRKWVDTIRRVPSKDWDSRCDEALVQYLVDTGQAADDKGGRASDLMTHVEKIELSSSTEHMNDGIAALTDDNPSTYWESDGSQSSHHIRLFMKEGTIIDKLYITIDVSDDSYLPHKLCVLGSAGKRYAKSMMKKLNEIDELEFEGNGDVCIFEAPDGSCASYAIVEIRILECKDEGMDTRIRGVKIKTREETSHNDFNVSIDEKRLQQYPLLLCSGVDLETMKLRGLVLKRAATLLDSVLHLIVPSRGINEKPTCPPDRIVPSLFSDILKNSRFLLPLSHKRLSVLERILKETANDNLESNPKIHINRQLARDNRTCPESTLFRQILNALEAAILHDEICFDYRWTIKQEQWWECKFIGEGVIDQGGAFRDSLCDISEELCPPGSDSPLPLPYFVRAPNQLDDEHNRDTFVVNDGCRDFEAYEWIGKLFGACVRTKEHLILPLAKFTWKQILGQTSCWNEDFVTIDRRLVRTVEKIQHMQKEEFDEYFGCPSATMMTTSLCDGRIVELIPDGSNIPLDYERRREYVDKVKSCRLSEGKEQIEAIRKGLLSVVPESVLNLLTWSELERRVSGNPEVSLEGLKKAARFEDLDGTERRVKFLWAALDRFTNDERSKFLRFVTGRRRLPTPIYICTDKGDSLLGDAHQTVLPESSTCSNMLFLPDYASVELCEEKLRYAIYNCLAIDTDMSPWEE